jgi:hypothetical protein
MGNFSPAELRRWSTVQTVTCTTVSTPITNALSAQTYAVRLVANTACHVAIGDGTQTGTTTNVFLPANIVEYVTVTPGQRISAIRASTGGLITATDGTLYVTELG